jgi:hypothetical protein
MNSQHISNIQNQKCRSCAVITAEHNDSVPCCPPVPSINPFVSLSNGAETEEEGFDFEDFVMNDFIDTMLTGDGADCLDIDLI